MTIKNDIGTLYRMLDVLDERGWTQNLFLEPETNSVCYLGAWLVATDQEDLLDSDRDFEPDWNTLPTALVHQFSLAHGPRGSWGINAIIEFNDADTTSEEDVKLSIKRAIEFSEEAEKSFAKFRQNSDDE